MKKALALFGLLACFSISMFAQDIVGKWRSEPFTEDNEQQMMGIFELTFNKNKTMLLNLNFTLSDPETMEMRCHFSINGTYSKMEDNVVPIHLDKDKTDFYIDDLKLNGEMAAVADKELIDGFKQILQQQFDENKEDLSEDFPENGEITITNLTNSSMTIHFSDEDKVHKMTRVK